MFVWWTQRPARAETLLRKKVIGNAVLRITQILRIRFLRYLFLSDGLVSEYANGNF